MKSPHALLLLAALLTVPLLGQARQESPSRSPRNANYTIDVTLDPAARRLSGTGRIRWRNITNAPTSELRLHLYWNAWREPASTWLSEQRLGRNPGLPLRPTEDAGWIDISTISRVTPDGPVNLQSGTRFIAPDDGNREDWTLMRVPLDQPVGPEEWIDLDVTWSARVPRTFARTGSLGDYFFLAQWFPKVAVLEDAGWNSHQFHAATEFFADFGEYDVSLTVPTGWTVGATGREVARTDRGDGTTTHRYVESDVHDFAWTTSPDFIERLERFDAPGFPPVDMRLLLQPEHDAQAGRHFAAARAVLSAYGSWFGPYPYSQLTIVDPAPVVHPQTQGVSTGGMEYPTLFTAGTRWSAPRRSAQPEAVTLHEAGHQFFQGIVATNEFEHAWMDEGLTTFLTARVMETAFPDRFVTTERYFGGLLAWPYEDVPWSRTIDGNRLNAYRPVADVEVPATPSWQYWPGTAGQISYNRTALWLATLERHLGWPTLQSILATYFERGAFRHPGPDEFFATASEVSGQDLTWFFDEVFRRASRFDYGVAHVQVVGAYDHITSTVVARRYGDGVFPVDVRVRFADGTEARERWDGQARWQAFSFDRPSAVLAVDVDPERVLLLDTNVTNNSWSARPRAAEAGSRWTWRWLSWAQELLLTYAFFA